MRRRLLLALILPVLGALAVVGSATTATTDDDPTIAFMQQANARLHALGLRVAFSEVEFLAVDKETKKSLHTMDNRFVFGDPRRPSGEQLGYLVDQSDGATASGLTSAQTEAAIDRAVATWRDDKCMKKVEFSKRPDSGVDPDLADGLLGFGEIGEPLLAEIVNGGWMPRAFFEALGGPGGGRGILGVTLTIIFTDDEGNPTDIDSDGYQDTALREIYYNDTFGQAGTDRERNPWRIDAQLPAIDVESVALHENGHALGLEHIVTHEGVMNPGYSFGHEPQKSDRSAFCAVWKHWR